MSDELYAVLAHVRPMSTCTLVPPETRDALARCYVMARGEGRAIVTVVQTLRVAGLETHAIKWSGSLSEGAPPDTEDASIRESEEQARRTRAVVIGKLDVWFTEQDF